MQRRRWMRGLNVALVCLGLVVGAGLAAHSLAQLGEPTRPQARQQPSDVQTPAHAPQPLEQAPTASVTPRSTPSSTHRPSPAPHTTVTIPATQRPSQAQKPRERSVLRPVHGTTQPAPSTTPSATAPASTPSANATPTSTPTPRPSTTPTPAPDRIPPGRVGSLKVADVTDTHFVVEWLPAHDNVAVTGYRVLINGAQQYVTATTVLVPIFTDPGGPTIVEVRALDAAGNLGTPADLHIDPVIETPSPTPTPEREAADLTVE